VLSIVCFLAQLRKWTGSNHAVILGILATDNSSLVN
jgi:hypothetical protein